MSYLFFKINFDHTGTSDQLRKFKVVVGGDQLTRVRLEGAKDLRMLSISEAGRLQHLHPVICEFWHMKQDLLEVCFKI